MNVETLQFITPQNIALLAIGLTTLQRLWILRRDNNKCQLPGFNGIGCGGQIEVDHIIPKRFARDTFGMREDEVDSPYNLLTLCLNHHRGHPQSKHPDTNVALYEYREGDKDSFKKMIEVREQQLADNEEYWNNGYDAPESAVALRNTLVYERVHPEDKYPVKK